MQHFWKRWKTDYISELQCRHRWQKTKGELLEGALIIIKDDNSSPTEWRLGRILSLHKGQDGVARVASIKTVNGVVRRSYNRLCLLPIDVGNPVDSKAWGMLPQ